LSYPLNMQLPAPAIGFSVANNEAEHIALTSHGYTPAYVAPVVEAKAQSKDAIMAELDAAGIEYDKRLGVEKLAALLPKD